MQMVLGLYFGPRTGVRLVKILLMNCAKMVSLRESTGCILSVRVSVRRRRRDKVSPSLVFVLLGPRVAGLSRRPPR